MTTPSDDNHHYTQFRHWLHSPEASAKLNASPSDPAKAAALLEAALWAAWQEGFRQGKKSSNQQKKESK